MRLAKRIPRELKQNWTRYLAMFLLIVLMLTVIVGLSGASDSVSTLLDKTAVSQAREHGEFKLFVPLSSNQMNELEDKGILIEEKFSITLPYDEKATLRMYSNRRNINRAMLDQGREAAAADEIMLEKHFAQEHSLQLNDKVILSDRSFKVVGIGSLPEYTELTKNLSDIMAVPGQFSVALVTSDAFDQLKTPDVEVDYEYSYLINEDADEELLRQYLQDMIFDKGLVANPYMKDFIARTENDRVKMTDAVNKLSSGSGEIQQNISALSGELRTFATEITDTFGDNSKLLAGSVELEEGTTEFSDGIGQFAEELKKLTGDNSELISSSEALKQGASELAIGMVDYANAIKAIVGDDSELSQAASGAAQGAEELAGNMEQLAQGVSGELGAEHELSQAATAVNEGALELSGQMNTFAANIKEELGSDSELALATEDLRSGCEELATGMSSFADALREVFGSNGDLLAAINELETGTTELTSGINEFLNGIQDSFGTDSDIVSATNELSQGALELFGGVNEYDSGVKEYQREVLDFINREMNFKYFNIIYFLKDVDNSRITACQDETDIYKMIILLIGFLTLLLVGYMMAIFTKNHIEKESVIIGTLYSLGYSKKEILRHYLAIPLILSIISSIVGTVIGVVLIPLLIENTTTYYSLPEVPAVLQPYLLFIGLVVPTCIIATINILVLNRKLNVEPLKLLKKSYGESKASKSEFGKLGFIATFRLRQLFREIGGNITMMCGLTIAILMMTLAFALNGSFEAYIEEVDKDIHYEYQYIMNYPMKIEQKPETGTIGYTETLTTPDPVMDSDVDIVVQGISGDNPYFPFASDLTNKEVNHNEHTAYVSSSAMIKFGWNEGADVFLKNTLTDKSYLFKVEKVVDYSGGLYLFMDIDYMRKVFGEDKNYINTLFSEEPLDIEQGRLETIITRSDLQESALRLYEGIEIVIDLVVFVSVILFVIVMYLLMKMMTGKATFSISLLKVMGYKEREVRKIYLGSGLYTVILTLLLALPLSYQIVGFLFPYVISPISIGMPMVIQPKRIAILLGIILGSYFVVNWFLGIYLKRISFTAVLKERE